MSVTVAHRVRRPCVYIVTCPDGTLYTGYTDSILRRIEQHNQGKGAKYTRGRRPVVLAYLEIVRSKREGLRREVQIKRMSRSAKLLLCTKYPRKPGRSPC